MPRPKSPNGSKPTKRNPTTTNGDSVVASTPSMAVEAPIVNAAQGAVSKTDPRKLEVVKSDSRASVVPINVEEEIRRRAYELSERRGFSSGHETEDWLMAEREVRRRYHQHSA